MAFLVDIQLKYISAQVAAVQSAIMGPLLPLNAHTHVLHLVGQNSADNHIYRICSI